MQKVQNQLLLIQNSPTQLATQFMMGTPAVCKQNSQGRPYGGYNGGRQGGWFEPLQTTWSGSGGATHIAQTTKRGVLKNYASYKSEVLIVAGGGGGSERVTGGAGGGTTGGAGRADYSNLTKAPTGGSQTAGGAYGTSSNNGNGSAGSFGQGGSGNGPTSSDGGGAGGGGWYGGGGITYAGGGGGGSGYIGGVTSGSMSSGVRSGHGYATITLTRWQYNNYTHNKSRPYGRLLLLRY